MHSNNKYDIIIENTINDWKISMMNQKQTEKWEVPRYSKSQINKAGFVIADPTSPKDEREKAITILNNWRAAHAYPLQVICSNLRKRNPDAIVVQRLKRLESIMGKLERFPDMNLYRMQDLGGCRVILDTIEQVYDSVCNYKSSRIRHIQKREYDYIKSPKTSGYRSYHMVYQFQSDKKETYNKNLLIEIQFRTKLQHIWATAVEMMGIYTKSNLKSSQGNKDILRFFTLVSSLFAIKEEMPICPNTSNWADELINEIMEIDKRSNILIKLKAINQAIQSTEKIKKTNLKNGFYLLILNYKDSSLKIYSFRQSDFEIAARTYSKIETEFIESADVVLVSVKSFDILKTAYPNYFVDISEFIGVLKGIMYNYSKYNKNARKIFESANTIEI